MKVGKQYVGEIVEITWRDPGSGRCSLKEAEKGLAALCEWKEYGMIDDITEGVVRIIHSAARSAAGDVVDEIAYTVVPDDLITSIQVYSKRETP